MHKILDSYLEQFTKEHEIHDGAIARSEIESYQP